MRSRLPSSGAPWERLLRKENRMCLSLALPNHCIRNRNVTICNAYFRCALIFQPRPWNFYWGSTNFWPSHTFLWNSSFWSIFPLQEKPVVLPGVADSPGRAKGSLVILCGCDGCSTLWWPQGSPHHDIARLKLKTGPVPVSQKSRISASLKSVKAVRGWQHLSQTLSHNLAVIESSPESLSLENEKWAVSYISNQKWA